MTSPIIWKLSIDQSSNVIIVNVSPDLITKEDPRIAFIAKNSSIKYIEISKIFKKLDDVSKYIYSITKTGYFHRRFFSSVLGYSIKKFEKIPIIKKQPTVIFVSYFLDHKAVETAIFWAEKNSFVKVFNNHGITPFTVNKNSEINQSAPLFDICIMNHNSEKNLPTFKNKNISKIYAVPRFSSEWSKKLNEIYQLKKNTNRKNKIFRPAFMLSKWMNKDDKHLILSAIKNVAKIKNTEVIVQPHTRGMVIEHPFPSNVFIANDKYNSRKIIHDSDVIIFTRSSIFLDAILLNKPIIHLSYATKVSLASVDLNCCRVCDEKDLFIKLDAIRHGSNIYTRKERENCLNFYAGNDNKMLDKISNEIKNFIN